MAINENIDTEILETMFFTYKIEKGKYELTQAVNAIADGTTTLVYDASVINKSVTIVGESSDGGSSNDRTVVVDDNTVFVVLTNAQRHTYEVFTGKGNVPTLTADSADMVALVKNGVAKYVYVSVLLKSSLL